MLGQGDDDLRLRRRFRSALAAIPLVVLLVASACQTSTEVDRASAANDAETELADSDATAESSRGEQMTTPSEVFEIARQSVVFIGSVLEARGSGVAIDGGWIVTNAHVVGRAVDVRIVTSDGDELGRVPVYAVDPVLDVAVLGPIEDTDRGPKPIVQAVSADVLVGETVYLLGYPDESNTLPVPTLTEGIVNRRRDIELRDYSFLQVDASIAPGQSGGALVDDQGRLIGLSGLRFGDAGFGLAVSTDALRERVQALIDGPSLADVFDAEPATSFEEDIGPVRYAGFMVDSDGRIELEVNSAGDTFIEVLSAAGSRKFEDWDGWDYFIELPRSENDYISDRTSQGTERLDIAVPPGAYQVLIGSVDRSAAGATINSATPLYPLPDVEEGAVLSPGEVFEGEFGWTKDSDRWRVPLNEGDRATITIDGLADVFGVVRFDGQVITSNDDAGFGVFGLGSKIEFTAAADGDYELEVGTRDLDRHGYFLQLEVS